MGLACIFGGRFWIAIMLARRNVMEGALAVFIPLLGVLWAVKRRGELLKGVVVLASGLIPLLLGLVFVGFFKPGGIASRGSKTDANMEKRSKEALSMLN